MQVIICSLPELTTEQEIRRLVMSAVCSPLQRFLRRQNKITCIEIIEIASQISHSTEYHAIIEFEQPDVAQLAIRKLNGSEFKNQQIDARHYQARSSYRDRRGQYAELPEHALAIHDRRREERRRPNLVQRSVEISGLIQQKNRLQSYALEMDN